MPYEWKDRSGTNIRYKDINEFPTNAKKFVNQLSSLGIDNITDIEYNVFTPNEDNNEDEAYNEIDIDISVDAEDAAKNKPLGFKSGLENKARNLGQYFGIDYFHIYVRFNNKEEFAKKFLKQLKAYLKTTEYGPKIHSIGFDIRGTSTPEIKITKKANSWDVSHNRLKETIENYLQSIGYPNIRIYFVN